jgi:hypothetical protein
MGASFAGASCGGVLRIKRAEGVDFTTVGRGAPAGSQNGILEIA